MRFVEDSSLVAAGGAGTDQYREFLEEWSAAMRATVTPAASDAAHAAVREDPSPEAWAAGPERAGEVQAAVTACALEIGEPRNAVEAAVKKAARYPESGA